MCDFCGWFELLDQIEEMLCDERYQFAEETLEKIYKWIEENQHCTKKQKIALENIYESKCE
jgi:hypothetical protein